MSEIRIPESIKPKDGRFGCGPSKVRSDALESLLTRAAPVIGTSHRQKGVKDVVHRVREGVGQAAVAALAQGLRRGLEDQHRRLHGGHRLLGEARDRAQGLGHGRAARDELEDLPLRGEQPLGIERGDSGLDLLDLHAPRG